MAYLLKEKLPVTLNQQRSALEDEAEYDYIFFRCYRLNWGYLFRRYVCSYIYSGVLYIQYSLFPGLSLIYIIYLTTLLKGQYTQITRTRSHLHLVVSHHADPHLGERS